MEKNISRRDFIKFAGVVAGGAFLASCSRDKQDQTTVFPTINPTKASTETATATPKPEDTATSTPKPELPLHIGEFDMRTTPFSIRPTPETEKFLGYIEGGFAETFADKPLPFGMQNIGSAEQIALQEEQNKTFEKAAYNHPENPYYVINSDLKKLTFFNFHSVQESACGEVARVVGAYAFNHPVKDGETDPLLGNKFIVTFDGKKELEGEIVHATTITKEYFDDLTSNGPWGIDEKTGGLYGLTHKFGIPNTIRYDQTPGVYYMTLIGCQNKEPGKISIWLSQNVVNRSLVTLKFDLRK